MYWSPSRPAHKQAKARRPPRKPIPSQAMKSARCGSPSVRVQSARPKSPSSAPHWANGDGYAAPNPRRQYVAREMSAPDGFADQASRRVRSASRIPSLAQDLAEPRCRSPGRKLLPHCEAKLPASSFAVRPAPPATPAPCARQPMLPQPRDHPQAKASIHNVPPPAP